MRYYWVTAFNNLVLIIILISVTALVSADSRPRNIPKWKLDHQARVANAGKVCATPTVSEDTNPKNLTTGFYTVNLTINSDNEFLDIKDGEVSLSEGQRENARAWLVSQVGAGLYDISSCYQGRPVCLSLASANKVRVTECDEIGYGEQTWWFKGYAVGSNKGEWYFGNDGVGQHQCFVATKNNELTLQPCTQKQQDWRFKRVANPVFQQTSTNKPYPITFPKGAESISYQCDSGAKVEVYYDTPQNRVFVRYNNQASVLNSTISASGEKYGDSKQPWGWWVKANMGSIYETNTTDVFLENCQEVNENQFSNQPARVWQAQAFEGGASVADCTDCEEDLGLVIRCKQNAQKAEVNVWLNADYAVETNQLVIEANVGGQFYHYPFQAIYYEMIGHHIAEFKINKDDLILNALQQANKVTFKVANDEFSIGLTSSNKAIDHFIKYCGWSD